MNNIMKTAFNFAIYAGDLNACKMYIREGLSVKSLTGGVKISPHQEIQMLLNFVDRWRGEEFSDEEVNCLIEDSSPKSLSNLELLGIKGMRQVLKEKQEKVEKFRRRPV